MRSSALATVSLPTAGEPWRKTSFMVDEYRATIAAHSPKLALPGRPCDFSWRSCRLRRDASIRPRFSSYPLRLAGPLGSSRMDQFKNRTPAGGSCMIGRGAAQDDPMALIKLLLAPLRRVLAFPLVQLVIAIIVILLLQAADSKSLPGEIFAALDLAVDYSVRLFAGLFDVRSFTRAW